ncbi:MAG: rRNA adenine N-6-methyltransferase family protein, partial [Limisphaerales bacterium]
MSLRLFFLDFLRSPLRMGSVVPSGRALARAMVDCARISPGHSVVELGAGTGAFTQAIVERCPDSTLTAFEISPVLGEVLVRRFPSVKVVVA